MRHYSQPLALVETDKLEFHVGVCWLLECATVSFTDSLVVAHKSALIYNGVISVFYKMCWNFDIITNKYRILNKLLLLYDENLR